MSADIDDELLREVMKDLASTEDLCSIPGEEYSNVSWKPPNETIPQVSPDEIIPQVMADETIPQITPDEIISQVIPDSVPPNSTNEDGNANQTIIIIPTLSVTGNVSYVLIVKKGGDSDSTGELIVTRTESAPTDLREQLGGNVEIEEAHRTDENQVASFHASRILEEGEIIEEGETLDTSPIAMDIQLFEDIPKFQKNTIFEESLLNDASEAMISAADQMDPNNIHVSHFLDLEKPPERKGVWYACDQCDYTHKKKSLTIRHMRTHSDNGAHICHLCQRAFKTATSLGGHLIVHSGTKPNTCKYCPSTFITSGELTRHIRFRHNEDKLHKCDYCDYTSLELCKVKRHAVQHATGFTFKCGYCSYAALNKYKLKYHLRMHTTNKPFKLFECRACQLSNMTFQEFQKHKLTHTLEEYCPKYPCKLCSISFSSRRDLNAHIQQMHFSPQPLKCTICEDSFPDLHTYKVHFSIHGKSNTLKCDKCPFSTSSLRYLQNHQILHEDQKLYSCEECAQSFPEMFLLNRHRKRSHKHNDAPSSLGANHKCSKCGRQFLQMEHFINHMTLHKSLKDSHPEMFLQKKAQKKEETASPIWEI